MRVWTHYKDWEDYKAGLYKMECEDENLLCDKSIKLLADTKKFTEIMELMALDWKVAWITNLSDTSQNRQAWLGQAACCYNHNAPDYITKRAWWLLTEQQRIEANKTAQKQIDLYDRSNNAETLF